MAQIMAKAAKVPPSPWPLMIGVVYEAGSNPAIPNRLPWSTAPNAVNKQTNWSTNRLPGGTAAEKQKQIWTNILTVDDDDLHHGSREEGQRIQRNFDEDGGDDEDKHDDDQTAHHTQTLRNTGTGKRSSRIGWELRGLHKDKKQLFTESNKMNQNYTAY